MKLLLALLALFFPVVATAPAVRIPPATFTIINYTRGGQREIDQGLIVLLTPCQPHPRTPSGCAVWLAGHRTTHGAVFRDVAYLQPGDTVSVLGWRYVVDNHRIVCCSGSPFVPQADLTLQTSATNGEVHLIEATQL